MNQSESDLFVRMGCCLSSAEPPPAGIVGRWKSESGTRTLTIDESGKISYEKIGMSITGMGLSGWEDEEGAKGHICCISQRLKVEQLPNGGIKTDGAIFKRIDLGIDGINDTTQVTESSPFLKNPQQ